MEVFKCFLAFAMVCAYARGMALPQSHMSPSRSPPSLSSTYSNRIHSSSELTFGSFNSESLEVTPFTRVLRSASPRRGLYDGSHRSGSTTSGYDGSHRSYSEFGEH
ncbi:unnamed protein product [Meganyctiphanes norvegica]|uniref:Uncharacterized protein n=1 Tax=Meganyctiphanes norvegica TaxID=48144 RepID=A0AAV2QTF1_MEGNR